MFTSPNIVIITLDSLFGDEREMEFWSVALYHILMESKRRQDPRYKVFVIHKVIYSYSDDSSIRRLLLKILRVILFVLICTHQLVSILDKEVMTLMVCYYICHTHYGSIKSGVFDNKATGMEAILQEAQSKTWQSVPPLDLCHDLCMDKNIYQVCCQR